MSALVRLGPSGVGKCVAAPGEATLAKRANWQGGGATGQARQVVGGEASGQKERQLARRRGSWPGEATAKE